MPRAPRSRASRVTSQTSSLSDGQDADLVSYNADLSASDAGRPHFEPDVANLTVVTIIIPPASGPPSPSLLEDQVAVTDGTQARPQNVLALSTSPKVPAGKFYCATCKKTLGIKNRSRHMQKHNTSSPRDTCICLCGHYPFTRSDACMRHMKDCAVAIRSGHLQRRLDELEWRRGASSRKLDRQSSNSSSSSASQPSPTEIIDPFQELQWISLSPTSNTLGSAPPLTADLPRPSMETAGAPLSTNPWDDLSLPCVDTPASFSSTIQPIVDAQGYAVPCDILSPISLTFPTSANGLHAPLPSASPTSVIFPYLEYPYPEGELDGEQYQLTEMSAVAGLTDANLPYIPPLPEDPFLFALELGYGLGADGPPPEANDPHQRTIELLYPSPQSSPCGTSSLHSTELDPFDSLSNLDIFEDSHVPLDPLDEVLLVDDAADSEEVLSASFSSLLLSSDPGTYVPENLY